MISLYLVKMQIICVPLLLYFVCAFLTVTKVRHKTYFMELAALLLQRTMEEGDYDLVLKWGQNLLEYISRCAFTM